VLVADWLVRGLLSPDGKAAKIYGPGGSDAKFHTEARRRAAREWFTDRRAAASSRATVGERIYGGGAKPLRVDRPPIDDAELDAQICRLAALLLPQYEAKREDAAKRFGLSLAILDRLVTAGRGSPSTSATVDLPAVKLAAEDDQAQAGLDRVPFPAGLDAKTFTGVKLQWLDECAADPNISHFALRVLQVMASKFLNAESGTAWAGHKRFAAQVHGTRRGVQKALDNVVTAGKLFRIVGGGRVSGGKGFTNSYRPLIRANAVRPSDLEGRTPKQEKGERGDMGRANAVRTTSFLDSLEDSRERAPAPGKDRRGRQKGTRLSAAWAPSPEDLAYARGKGYAAAEIDDMAEKFRNYWLAATAPNAEKMDWAPAWRNWVIDEPRFKAAHRARDTDRTAGGREFAAGQPRVATKDPNLSDPDWLEVLMQFRISQDWNPAHGPTPYQSGCFAPKELQDEAGIVIPLLIRP
jgi:hypothetical protein